jgi:signal transduction histidine kinase
MEATPATVLVVEDNEYNCEMLAEWLAMLGHHVLTAGDGREALEILSGHACDLMLLDIMMPEMDGYEVLAQLKSDGRLHQLPVIVISAVDETKSAVKCIELGAEDYLTKPFDQVLLRARIDASLEKKRLREQEAVYQQRLLAAQKFTSLGTLAAGVAHEMNSPLQVVTGMSETLLYYLDQCQLDPPELRRCAEAIQRNAWRCAQISAALRTYAQATPDQSTPQDLNGLVGEALLLAVADRPSGAATAVSVETDLKPGLPPLRCDRSQLVQAVVSLLCNAYDAMPGGGHIWLHTNFDTERRQLVIQVQDTGAGIPDAIRDRIFDPFFTTKPVGLGMGLGLSTLQGIVKAHHGQVEVASAPGQGATFTIRLPEHPGPAEAPVEPANRGRFDDTVVAPAVSDSPAG